MSAGTLMIASLLIGVGVGSMMEQLYIFGGVVIACGLFVAVISE